MTGLAVTPRGDRELVLTRAFAAPPARVFAAWTRPELLMRWYGARGWRLVECTVDLRVGGAWRFVNRHPKGEAAFHGEYLEIVPPSRLAFTEIFDEFPDSVSWVTTDLTEEDGKTRMSVTCRYGSMAVRDMVKDSGMEKGAAISYDRLEDLVIRLKA